MSDALFGKLEEMRTRFAGLEGMLSSDTVSADPARLSAIAKEHGKLRRPVEMLARYRAAEAAVREADALLADPAGDAELKALAAEELPGLRGRVTELHRGLQDELLAGEELAAGSLIMEIRAGTGGDEAALFAGDLFDMYRRYAEARRWKLEVLSSSEGAAGGWREVTFGLAGADVWKRLAHEAGGHRVQRVPATETQGRVHTSAATVAVLPEPEDVVVHVPWDDPKVIREEAMRSSGPGGQNVNKVNSAVRLTHLETGIVVHIQGRDWHQNRAQARRVMLGRLHEHFAEQERRKRESTRRTMIGSGDRSERIRTYNFPQDRCTDHRLNRNFPLAGVVAGGLDELTDALIEWDRAERLARL